MYKNNKNIVRTNNEESRGFSTEIGVQQGCVLVPLSSVTLDKAIKGAKENMKKLKLVYRNMTETCLTELLFANDMTIVEDTKKE